MSGISDLLLLVNSDMNEPLNYLHWINDLATFGTDSYIYNQPEKMSELASKSLNASFNVVCFDLLINGYADKVFTKLTGDETNAFSGLTTMELVVEDETAMTVIANSEKAMMVVASNIKAMTVVVNSTSAITTIINSETAMKTVANSEIALEIMLDSWTIKESIWGNATASNILMTTSTSKDWLVANLAVEYSVTGKNITSEVNAKGGFVLSSTQTFEPTTTPDTQGWFGYIKPSNTTSEETGCVANRVQPCTLFSGRSIVTGVGYFNGTRKVVFVQMQE